VTLAVPVLVLIIGLALAWQQGKRSLALCWIFLIVGVYLGATSFGASARNVLDTVARWF
jgi:hypothetical protein